MSDSGMSPWSLVEAPTLSRSFNLSWQAVHSWRERKPARPYLYREIEAGVEEPQLLEVEIGERIIEARTVEKISGEIKVAAMNSPKIRQLP